MSLFDNKYSLQAWDYHLAKTHPCRYFMVIFILSDNKYLSYCAFKQEALYEYVYTVAC